MTPPKFLYFDLGKVLVDFSVEQMLRQLADVSGVNPECVREILYNDGLMRRYESGQISSQEFYETYCAKIGSQLTYDRLCYAGSTIFSLNLPLLPIVTQLRQAGYRMGILSNTCECHWQYCFKHYSIVAECFHVYALSYRIGALKPDVIIYQAAAELAGCRPEDIFFIDDIPGHVEGAKSIGIDAILYTSAKDTAAALRRRGLCFNY
ncbi:MAG TPA: HAD family phosphatase [Thermoguttaceae bacterium]